MDLRKPVGPFREKAEPLGRCPCGQEIFATCGKVPSVMHTAPACHKFLELEVTEFLRYVRHSRGLVTDN